MPRQTGKPSLPLAAGGSAFLLPLLLYTFTTAPGVTLVDSGEVVLAAWDPGVAHPPGFPLYVLLGHLCARLPWAEPARNLNLFSALCGAAACWLVWLCAREAVGLARGGGAAIRRVAAGQTDVLVALSAALIFACTFVLWGFATFSEVYTLGLALWLASLYFLLRFLADGGEEASIPPRLLMAALLWAFSFAVHLATAALTAPAFVFAALVGARGGWAGRHAVSGDESKRSATGLRPLLLHALLAALVATLLYGTILLLGRSGPLFGWGDPSTLHRWFRHVSAWQYQGNLFSAPGSIVAGEAWRIGRHLLLQATPAGFLLALWGAFVLWRRRRGLFSFLLLLAAFNLFYSLAYDINEDKEAYYQVTFVAGALCLAVGGADLLDRVAGRRLRPLLAAGLLLLPLAPLTLHWRECNLREDRRAERFVREACDPLAAGALLLTREWQLYSPWLYLHHARGYRPDLRLVDVNLVRRSWYMNYLEREMPELLARVRREQEAFQRQLTLFEEGKPYDPTVIQGTFVAFLNGLTGAAMAEGQAVHLIVPLESGVGTNFRWVPHGLTFRLEPREGPAPPPAAVEIQEGERWVWGAEDLAGRKVRWLHGEMLYWSGRYLAELGRTAEAGRLAERAMKIQPPGEPYPGR